MDIVEYINFNHINITNILLIFAYVHERIFDDMLNINNKIKSSIGTITLHFLKLVPINTT